MEGGSSAFCQRCRGFAVFAFVFDVRVKRIGLQREAQNQACVFVVEWVFHIAAAVWVLSPSVVAE